MVSVSKESWRDLVISSGIGFLLRLQSMNQQKLYPSPGSAGRRSAFKITHRAVGRAQMIFD
jgi:hypothetical protein